MKILLDTNILINVILSPSKASASYKVFELCSAKKLEPQLGCALFNEYEDLFHRPETQAKSVYTGRELEKILDGFLSVCKWHKVSYLWRPNLSDEADNHLIDLAVASNTQWIITQNIKNLSSGELKFDFQAISPDNFLENIYGNNYLSHH